MTVSPRRRLEYLDDVVTRLEQANTASKLARGILEENQKESLRALHALGVTWIDKYEKIKRHVHIPSEEDVAVSQFRSLLNAIARRLK